jgi:hypothetical protein
VAFEILFAAPDVVAGAERHINSDATLELKCGAPHLSSIRKRTFGIDPGEDLQKLRRQIHGRGLRNARGGLPLYRTQPRAGQIHDVVPIYCKFNLIWSRYKIRGAVQ